ncbi:DUF2164 domain-containing protein [Silvimonas iriomotensis]|uniref:DUF2164 domain-containing protein n=1 Tax=Silvimonas iriomotensis TaxID=449662 RepID=A0ABQ2P9X4_9NEIS|nr:DUF2164 domain-containing protein [Silvimonas iriomotensis]GGP21923.1 hypothetical protein GCM10010970_22880 [Silvimonas iriomotensis]
MSMELDKDAHKAALDSLEKYLRDELELDVGNLEIAGLLTFFVQEIGPSLYNKGVRAAQEQMQARVADIDMEVYADEFGYWKKSPRRR